MTVREVLARLESLGDAARRTYNAKAGAPGNQFGVPMGDIRTVARAIKPPAAAHALARPLWDTGNMEAQLVATLIVRPKDLTADEVDAMTRTATCAQVADWLNAYVIVKHPAGEALRTKWMKDKDRWAARAGWHLTASRVGKGDDADLDLPGLLDRIEKEMPKARPEVQWTMNNTLMAIGVKHAAHRARAIAIGEKIGLYKDWPQSKGCIIPYAPTAIDALSKKKG